MSEDNNEETESQQKKCKDYLSRRLNEAGRGLTMGIFRPLKATDDFIDGLEVVLQFTELIKLIEDCDEEAIEENPLIAELREEIGVEDVFKDLDTAQMPEAIESELERKEDFMFVIEIGKDLKDPLNRLKQARKKYLDEVIEIRNEVLKKILNDEVLDLVDL
jgi:hypothetical protein